MAISAIILAGGRATRMNGIDKGWALLKQRALISHVIARLSPQVDDITINANRELERYAMLGYPVWADTYPDFVGPLAGISLGLQHAQHQFLLSVPCDCPLLPLDLADRLLAAINQHQAEIAVASSHGRSHPVFCLCKKSVLPSLQSYLQQGNRRVSDWQKSLAYVEVDFTDTAQAFINLNTADDLAALEWQLSN
jgi:molybdopterin-guanine dinucleotide biosynthesis protein A